MEVTKLLELNHTYAVLEEYAIAVRNAYQDKLILNDRIAKGDLLNSAEYRIGFDGQTYSVILQLAEYWKYVEYGTKPHFPPVDKLREWVLVKPVIPRPDKDGNLPTPSQLAYLIGRKIAEHGTEGSHDLEETTEELNAIYLAKIREALALDVAESAEVMFREF